MSGMLRVAIALHPAAWRARFGDEVAGTMQDIADDRGGSVPLGESIPLAFRGLWMRVRRSVTFWAGLAVIAILVVDASTADHLAADGSLTSLLRRLDVGLWWCLPVIAVASGWAGARARAESLRGVRARLRRLLADSWPLIASVVIGYGLAVVILVARTEFAWLSFPVQFVVIGHFAMVLIALAVGQAFGAVLPRVVVIFVAPIMTVTVLMLLLGWQNPWNVQPSNFYNGLAFEVDTDPAVQFVLIAAAIGVIAVAIVSIRSPWARAIPLLAVIGVGAFVANQPFTPQEIVAVERPLSELVCSTTEPVVCLWPEQEAAFGDSVRADMAKVHSRAVSLGLPVDNPGVRNVAQFTLTGVPLPDGLEHDETTVGYDTFGISPRDFAAWYAMTIPFQYWEIPKNGEGEMREAQHAVSLLLGIPAEDSIVAMVDPYTGQRSFDPSRVPDATAAQGVVDDWFAGELDGVRSPVAGSAP